MRRVANELVSGACQGEIEIIGDILQIRAETERECVGKGPPQVVADKMRKGSLLDLGEAERSEVFIEIADRVAKSVF